jgi:hypothetical protein
VEEEEEWSCPLNNAARLRYTSSTRSRPFVHPVYSSTAPAGLPSTSPLPPSTFQLLHQLPSPPQRPRTREGHEDKQTDLRSICTKRRCLLDSAEGVTRRRSGSSPLAVQRRTAITKEKAGSLHGACGTLLRRLVRDMRGAEQGAFGSSLVLLF